MPIPIYSYQEKLEAIVAQAVEAAYSHESLCRLLSEIIDEFCQQQPAPEGAGRPKTYPDSTILKLAMLMPLSGKRGETEMLREAQRHYSAYFGALPGQSRLWHRLRQAMPLMERFRQYLLAQLGVSYEDLRIVDTCPIPVATATSRRGKGNGFDLAEGGYCASKKLSYLGFKLGVLITPQGIPDRFELFPARPHDSQLLAELVGEEANECFVLGDKGFISKSLQQTLAQEQQVALITYRRRNQKQRNSQIEQWALHHYRPLVETVFSQLTTMHLENCGAKTDLGLVKRVLGIMTAYTFGIYLNFLLGRPLLAIKALFA